LVNSGFFCIIITIYFSPRCNHLDENDYKYLVPSVPIIYFTKKHVYDTTAVVVLENLQG
jgi:hypothetical protein